MRQHFHIKTRDLARSTAFYTILYGEPALVKPGYVKWEPVAFPVIVSVTEAGDAEPGIDHMGLKGDASEIGDILARLHAARFGGHVQQGAECCYIVADKEWIKDPSGVPYEIYSGTGTIEYFGDDRRPAAVSDACCAPALRASDPNCCAPVLTDVPDSVARLFSVEK
jgi:hypothetical protein